MMWKPYTTRIVVSDTEVVIADAMVKRISFFP